MTSLGLAKSDIWVDHTILSQRLRIRFGVNDVALQWITSFLKERTQQLVPATTVSCPSHRLCCLEYHRAAC